MAVLLNLLSRLPLGVLYALGFVLYLVLYRVVGVRKQVVLGNLGDAFPELGDAEVRRLARGCYRNYTDVAMEMIKSISIDRRQLVERVWFEHLELIEGELARGQPVLVTVAHQCNIEWLLLSLCCRLDYPMEAVYRPIANAAVEQVMAGAYTRFGGVLIDDRSVVKEIMARRRVPRVVAIASDQAPNINDQKLWVRFLNQETAFFLAPDTLARFVNYPVYFLTMRRTSRGRYVSDVKRIAEPPYTGQEHAVVRAYIAEVEGQILEHPEDWLWLHQRWKRKKSVYD